MKLAKDLKVVRESGKSNMFDRLLVAYYAEDFGMYDLADYLYNCSDREYADLLKIMSKFLD